MGVPKFFRWVTTRYPVTLSDELPNSRSNSSSSSSISHQIPDFDNLYLDMNGIIHACSHNDKTTLLPAISFDMIVNDICKYVDNLVINLIQPLQLLYIAVDGVAPRAKLNQQRSRRFRASYDMNHILNSMKSKSKVNIHELFDSNCITPGTEFMFKLSMKLKEFIEKRMKENIYWSRIQVIFSGSEVPGEGEHKIISFIRNQRASSDYKPNQRHIMNGQDADMIMLALATHEPYFYILREVLVYSNNHQRSRKAKKSAKASTPLLSSNIKFQFFRVNILRECLINELTEELSEKVSTSNEITMDAFVETTVDSIRTVAENKIVENFYDVERIIDDFVFLTFLIGNDFLPSIPSLSIGEGAFDIMFATYKDLLINQSIGYITNRGMIENIERLQMFFDIMSLSEASIIEDQYYSTHKHPDYTEMIKKDEDENEENEEEDWEEGNNSNNRHRHNHRITNEDREEKEYSQPLYRDDMIKVSKEYEDLWEDEDDVVEGEVVVKEEEKQKENSGDSHNHHDNKVQNHSKSDSINFDYRQYYYKQKFSIDVQPIPIYHENNNSNSNSNIIYDNDNTQSNLMISSNPIVSEELNAIRTHYIAGLMWCLSYYSKGCCNWKWFYPYHYSPLLKDLSYGLTEIFPIASSQIFTELGKPFLPFQQLLGCLPPSSAQLLPLCYQKLILSENIQIKEYYPTSNHLQLDMTNKTKPWEAIVLLPFIDESKLLQFEREYCLPSMLSLEEAFRNQIGYAIHYSVDERSINFVMNTIIQSNSNTASSNSMKNSKVQGSIPSNVSLVVVKREIESNIHPCERGFEPKLIVGTVIKLAGYLTLQDIYYQSRNMVPKSFPNNCCIRLRFGNVYEAVLIALTRNIQQSCPYFIPLGQDCTLSKINIDKPYNITLCSSLHGLNNNQVTVSDVMNRILPQTASQFHPIAIRIGGKLVQKRNKTYVMLYVEDITHHTVALGQYISKQLPGCNSWCVDESDRLSLTIGTYNNSYLSSIPSSDGVDSNHIEYKLENEEDKMKSMLESVIIDEINKLSENQGYLDLICEEIEVSEELINYPRSPIRLTG